MMKIFPFVIPRIKYGVNSSRVCPALDAGNPCLLIMPILYWIPIFMGMTTQKEKAISKIMQG